MYVMLCASKFINGDIDYNSSKIIEMLKKPSNNKIDFLFFGESFLNGFDSLQWDYKEDKKLKQKTKDTVEYLGQMAKQYNRGLGFGYFEFDNAVIYSSYIVYDSEGIILCNYRRITKGWKTKNANEDHYKEGLSIGEFTYKNKHFGISLCGDLWYDKLYKEIQNKNFDVLIWPVYINYNQSEWERVERFEYLSKSKSISKKTLFINSVSDEPAFGGTYFQDNQELIAETKLSTNDMSLIAYLDFE